jgi:hypothetical protein
MIEYRLLVDLEAVVELDNLSKRDRSRLLLFFEKLRSHPEHYASANERDDRGRRLLDFMRTGSLIELSGAARGWNHRAGCGF